MRHMRKIKLAFEEHQRLGRRLKAARQILLDAFILTAKAYPLKGKAVVSLDRAGKYLEKARCELDNAVGREYPQVPDRDLNHVYYGGSRTECLPTIRASDIPPATPDPRIRAERDGLRIRLIWRGVRIDRFYPADTINTPQKLLGMVAHLSEKRWMTPSLFFWFIRLAHQLTEVRIF